MISKLENRLREAAKKVGGIRALSEKSGIGERTIANWLTGTEPRVHALHAVATAADVSIDWLVSGIEPVSPPPARHGGQVDQALMGRCSDAFGKLYKEMGIALSPLDLGRLAGEVYNDVIAGGAADIETQLVVIRSLVERHRRELQDEAAANAQGKRSAS